jgi:low affinity Fe/Cu permease
LLLDTLNIRMHWYNTYRESLKLGDRISDIVTSWTGSFAAFCMAFLVIIIWMVLGPYYSYSDTWQLVINTGTTIVTFLMVFLIQNNQNRQAERDRIHAEMDYQTNLITKQELEYLQIYIERIEIEKLNAIKDLTDDEIDKIKLIMTKIDKIVKMMKPSIEADGGDG